MPDPFDTSDVLSAPLDASEATGTDEFVWQDPPGDVAAVCMQPVSTPARRFASFSFNVGPPGAYDNDLTWIEGCLGLGFQPFAHVKSNAPPLAEMTGFLAQSPNWVLFVGHFYAMGEMSVLGPTLANIVIPETTHAVAFFDRECTAKSDSGGVILQKGADFRLNEKVEVVFWAGCHALKNTETITRLRSLFGSQVLMLGFVDMTGWEVTKAIFGGEVPERDTAGNPTGRMIRHSNSFFAQLSGKTPDAAAVRNAWLDSAAEFYKGAELCSRFSAVDPDGTWWQLNQDGTKKTRTQ